MAIQTFRKNSKSSGGQAIVMVTLALFAMAGMMGLAVDLGWSFFVGKQAQAAADGAALAAAQEQYRMTAGSTVQLTCGGNAVCSSTPISCGTVSSGPLRSGCLYAAANGFNPVSNARQHVMISADASSTTLSVPGISDIQYWVTVSADETIPQLFSSILGNTQGTVSAIATAGIAKNVLQATIVGLNQPGDCYWTGSARHCGVDVATANNGLTCPNTGVSAELCAPNGIIMASSCNGGATSIVGCSDPGSSVVNYAGEDKNGQGQAWSQGFIKARSTGTVMTPQLTSWNPLPTNGEDGNQYNDPMLGKAQPPINLPSSGNLPTCGIANSNKNGPGATLTGTVGNYQYYSMYNGTPDYQPISIKSTTVTFSAGAACPGTVGGGTPPSSNFPVYVFWGGLNISGSSSNTAVNFGPGQYVLAGVGNCSKCTSGTSTLAVTGGVLTTDQNAGVMIINTDGNYVDGNNTSSSALRQAGNAIAANFADNFVYGSVSLKNANGTLAGVNLASTAVPSSLKDYGGILYWQDRGNSYDNLQTSDGKVITKSLTSSGTAQPLPLSYGGGTTHVSQTSPEFLLASGGASFKMSGVSMQPRGSWMQIAGGGGQIGSNGSFPLQIITGALFFNNGGGTAAIALTPSTNQLSKYSVALIR